MPSGIYPKNQSGWKHTIETKKKISGMNIGKKHPHNEETKKIISKALKGIKRSQEFKDKISNSLMGNKRTLGKHWKNKPSTIEKRKLANRLEKNPSWKEGKSFEEYSINWTETLRRAIRERDNYICQKCSQYGNVVHHIDYEKYNCNPDNLITLCLKCNSEVNFNREYWTNYFQNIIAQRSQQTIQPTQ